jgi:hypothetical protein
VIAKPIKKDTYHNRIRERNFEQAKFSGNWQDRQWRGITVSGNIWDVTSRRFSIMSRRSNFLNFAYNQWFVGKR